MNKIKAIFFDQDGVIIDTERDGHRVAFNETFRDFGFKVEWSVDQYHELLQVGGGKERMRHYLHAYGFGVEVKPEDEERLIQEMHRRKTALFIDLVENKKMPLRPGVRRVMKEAMAAGLVLAICTTSNEKAAHAISTGMLNDITFDFVLAGDVVSRKKPDPEIYHLAAKQAGVRPEECIVIEDSRNGVLAGKAAGMHVVVTTNGYTEQEDLHAADLIVTCLGDPNGEKGQLTKGHKGLNFDGVLYLEELMRIFSRSEIAVPG